jgi:hypothetical protein
MMQLGIIDANDMLIEAELEDSVFNIGLSWNEEGQLWTLSIRDLNLSILASGIAVVPSFPLLRQIRKTYFPPGEIAVYSVNNRPLGRKSFVNGEAAMFYFSREDLGIV